MVRKRGSCVLSIRLLGAGQGCLLESLWAKQLSVNYAQRRTVFPAGKEGSREKHVLNFEWGKSSEGFCCYKAKRTYTRQTALWTGRVPTMLSVDAVARWSVPSLPALGLKRSSMQLIIERVCSAHCRGCDVTDENLSPWSLWLWVLPSTMDADISC